MNIVRCVSRIADWRHFYELVLATRGSSGHVVVSRGSCSTGSSGNVEVSASGFVLVCVCVFVINVRL